MVVAKVSDPVSSWMPEGEHGRLERRHRDPPLGDDAHEQRDQRAVAGADQGVRVEVVGQVVGVGVVVEGDHLHALAAAQVAEVAEPVGVHGVDEDQPADAVAVHVRRVHHGDGVGVQRLELAHVAVDGAAEADLRLRVQLVRGDHRGERVEVGVAVRGDEFGRTHELSIRGRRRAPSQALSSQPSS